MKSPTFNQCSQGRPDYGVHCLYHDTIGIPSRDSRANELQGGSPPESWAAWANAVWFRSSYPDDKSTSHYRINHRTKTKKSKTKKRVSFSDECVEYDVPKYTETRSDKLFISRCDIVRNNLVSDSEFAQFGEDRSALDRYNDWLLNDQATKISGGLYRGRLGLVEKICASKVYVKLIGDEGIVCINRSSIAEGHYGSHEVEIIHQNSLMSQEDAREANKIPPPSQTTKARTRRSKRLAKKAAQRRCTF